ncbi:hypothetical protein OROGR_013000 [Orobanche gracilis]
MVVGESPEWLPSGFTEKVKYKSGRKFKRPPPVIECVQLDYFRALTLTLLYLRLMGTVGCETGIWVANFGNFHFGSSGNNLSVLTQGAHHQLYNVFSWTTFGFRLLPYYTYVINGSVGCETGIWVANFGYYYNVATGAKYYSKKDVLNYATAENGLLGTPQKSNGDGNELSSNREVDAGLDKLDDSPKWLPDGWTVEEKTRQRGSRRGSVYK